MLDVKDTVVTVDVPQSATKNSYTFALVHGGCHDGSLWQPVIERLEAYDQHSPEPFGSWAEPLKMEKFHSLRTPRSFLVGAADMVMPPGDSGWHPRMSSRLGKFRLVQMPGSHEAVFTDPIGLADKFVEAGRD